MSDVTRHDIAAAMTGVTVTWSGQDYELTGTPAQPAALAVWQAWPDWQAAEWLTRCVMQRTWQVFVILPAGDADAWTGAADSAMENVRAALIPLGQVTRAEPIALVAGNQALTMPALAFTLLTT